MNKLIYRFETESGVGAFGCGAAIEYDIAINSAHSAYDPPAPHDDREDGSAMHQHANTVGLEGFHFGFASIAQLRRWFRWAKGRRAMLAAGCRLYVYSVEADAMLTGRTQVVFRKTKATRVGELDMTTLKPLGVVA